MRHPPADKNFDELALRLADKVYGGLKGRLRLAVLARDCEQYCPARIDVLDVGGGEGRMAEWFLQRGQRLHLVDISPAMVARAQSRLAPYAGLATCEIAGLAQLSERGERFGWVNAHAVLEWLADPAAGLRQLQQLVAPSGYLSLLVYNRAGWAFKNLLRGNFAALAREGPVGHEGGLTPLFPQDPLAIIATLAADGYQLLCASGIRVFSDYDHAHDLHRHGEEICFQQELKLSREEPYWRLGRYVHLLFKRADHC